MNAGRQIALQYLSRFPDAPTKTLAILAYKENPSVWPTVESARSAFRNLRGACGDRNRRVISEKTFFREPKKSGDPFTALPPELKCFSEEWGAVILGGPAKCLVISDLHIPYYDKSAVIESIRYGVNRGADTVILLGDIADFHAVSFWETDPRERKFSEEIKAVNEFLKVVRKQFPKARIIYKLGNHEDRLYRYMCVKAPELLGIAAFEFSSILGLDALDITLVGDNRPIRLGKLNLIHGHEYKFAISNPVNPARGLYLRGKAHAICGHFHQTSQHSEKSLEENVISTWSLGCLCDLHPKYRPLNGWNCGFAYVDVDRDGAFSVQNLRIVHGQVY